MKWQGRDLQDQVFLGQDFTKANRYDCIGARLKLWCSHGAQKHHADRLPATYY